MKKCAKYAATAILTSSLITAPDLAAQERSKDYCTGDSNTCTKVGSWSFSLGMGAGIRTNPVVGGDDIPIILLPKFAWYGERFFIENTELGYTLAERPQHTVNLLATLELDAFFFDDGISPGSFILEGNGADFTDAPAGGDGDGDGDSASAAKSAASGGDVKEIDDRRPALMAGLEYVTYRGSWLFSAQALSDASGVHDGQSLRAGLGYQINSGNDHFDVFGGVSWQSAALLDYYYGINAREVNDASLVFSASDATSHIIKFGWRRQLSRAWSLSASVRYKRFAGQTDDSPLLEKNQVITAFFGGVYHF